MVHNHIIGWLRRYGIAAFIAMALLAGMPQTAQAQDTDSQEFNIQVSPATLPVTLTPGKQQSVTITVRNFSNHSETLVPRLSGFKIDQRSQKIELDYKAPVNMASWLTFGQSEIVLKAGESKPLDIRYDTPRNVGFSYTAAITLSRANEDFTAPTTGASLKGTVAIFNLININRPDAKRELQIEALSNKKGSYEFLPATFNLAIKNSGNVIDQPAGNIFIQRSFDDTEPIATIPINSEGGYILPGNTRQLTAEWKDGFPVYANNKLSWDWHNLGQLRFGKYVAKVVLVYNDGQRDVPIIASVNFWVIPWRILIISLIVIIVLGMGLFGWGRLIAKGTKKVRRYAVHK